MAQTEPKDIHIFLDIETTGLDFVKNRITCICTEDDLGQKIQVINENEKTLLNLFDAYFGALYPVKGSHINVVTHYGSYFDLPFIYTRCKILGITLKHFFGYTSKDTYLMRKASLSTLASQYTNLSKTGDGADAVNLFKFKKYDQLVQYCANDVKVLKAVYQAMLKKE